MVNERAVRILLECILVVFFFQTEGQSFNWDKMGMTHALRCIGIAPWGYVERKENLVSNDGHVSICNFLIASTQSMQI